MITPNSCLSEGGEADAEDHKGTLTSSIDFPIGLFQSGMWDARDMRKYGFRYGFPINKKGSGNGD